MMKKFLAVVLSCSLAISALAGCSGSGSGSSAAGSESKSNSAQNVTLSVFDCQAYGLDGYQKVVDAFQKANPGVTVKVQHAANDGNTILQSRFNSGDKPDVFACEPGTNAASYFEYAYDWSKDTDVLSKFKDGTTDLGKDKDGKVKGLPWTYENMGLIYNKECFTKAGITALPTTLDELAQDCEKLKAAGITPFALAAKEGWVLGQLSTHFMMDKKLDAKGTIDGIESGSLKFKNMPNWKNIFKFLDLVKKYDSPKLLETDWEGSENAVATGKAAMLHMGDWAQANFTKFNPKAQIGFIPFPVGKGEADSTLLSSVGWVYFVNKDSKNLELAKKYAEFILTSEEGQTWMTKDVNAVPCCKTQMSPSGDLPKDAQNYINQKKTNGWIHTIAPADFSDVCGPILQAYLGGQASADSVTEQFQQYFDSAKK